MVREGRESEEISISVTLWHIYNLSSGLKRDAIKHLLETDGVDVWHVGHGGGVDFRVSSEQFQKMKAELPGCSEAMSVEQLVKDEEKKRANRQLDNKTKQDWWFERYVSQTLVPSQPFDSQTSSIA